jgi:hypothetical protein
LAYMMPSPFAIGPPSSTRQTAGGEPYRAGEA